MKMLPKLPDCLNPVFVKDLRYTCHRISFWVLNAILVLLTCLFALKEDWWELSFYTSATICNLILFFQSVSLINYWAKENILEQLAPQKITGLSALRILIGRLLILLLSLIFIELCCLLPGMILNPDVFLQEEVFLQLAFDLFIYLTLTAYFSFISMPDPYSNVQKVHTGLTIFFATLCFIYLIIPLTANPYLPHNEKAWLLLFFLFAFCVLVWYTKFTAWEANRMLPIRLGSPLLFLLFIALAYGILGTKDAGIFSFLLTVVFSGIQLLLLVTDPLQPTKRMELDAPKNPIAKGIWYFCGTGALGAWIYGIPILIAITSIFTPHLFSFVLLAYLLIYAALTMWLRLAFPAFLGNKGGLLYLGICFGALVVDCLLMILTEMYFYLSPLSIGVKLLEIVFSMVTFELIYLAVTAFLLQETELLQEIVEEGKLEIEGLLNTSFTYLAIITGICVVITIAALIFFNKKKSR